MSSGLSKPRDSQSKHRDTHHSFLPSVSSAGGLWAMEGLSKVFRREPEELRGDWGRLGEHRKKVRLSGEFL